MSDFEKEAAEYFQKAWANRTWYMEPVTDKEIAKEHFDIGRKYAAEEITTLRQQLEQAEQENERVRQANLDVMMHFEDMKAAKERAEAIAESEILGFQTVAIEICRQEADEWDSDRLHTFKNYAEACGKRIGKLMPANARAQLLQLRAEAVEAFLLEQAPLLDRYRPGPINEQDHCCEFNLLRERERLHSEANRLRAKAEEQEKGGWDES